jgi:hypothetical protein
MQNKRARVILWIVVIIIVITLILPVTMYDRTPPAPTPEQAPRNDIADPNLATTTEEDISNMIVVTSPTKGQTVTSPMTVKGRAMGSWYFEASFPIELVNAETGLIIARGYGQAEGEWMTTNFVPFTGTLTFPNPATTTRANLILRKDNPSGDPERDASITIPVTIRQ